MDAGAAARIAKLAVGDDATLPLIEVGPGTGALTRALLGAGARPQLIEIDPDMVAILRGEAEFQGLSIYEADALTFDYSRIAADGAWLATGNLPYNIGTPLLMQWVESPQPPLRIVAMLQRDVADRIVAKPNSAQYGSLAISCQISMDVQRAFILGPQVFYPRPKVDSAVVVLQRRATPAIAPELIAPTRALARAAFAYRRKTFSNSVVLSNVCSREQIAEVLTKLGFDSRVRGEELSLQQFAAIAEGLRTTNFLPEQSNFPISHG